MVEENARCARDAGIAARGHDESEDRKDVQRGELGSRIPAGLHVGRLARLLLQLPLLPLGLLLLATPACEGKGSDSLPAASDRAADRTSDDTPATPTEPASCRKLKALFCQLCGEGSQACRNARTRRGSDAQKCRSGLSHFGMYASDKGRRELLCDVLKRGAIRPAPRRRAIRPAPRRRAVARGASRPAREARRREPPPARTARVDADGAPPRPSR
jgi:hypothetical protein